MKIPTRCLGLVAAAVVALPTNPGVAQKSGGVLKIEHMDTPPSASILEEATVSTVVPFMGLFNNLVMYDQNVARNSLDSIVRWQAAWRRPTSCWPSGRASGLDPSRRCSATTRTE